MKAEINNENKAKFFALYWGQNVLPVSFWGSANDISYHIFRPQNEYDFNNSWLNLKPLSSISDEDAIEVSKIRGVRNNLSFFGKEFIGNLFNDLYISELVSTAERDNTIDFLRSKGYALPWMGLSVEKLIEAGWIKLIEV